MIENLKLGKFNLLIKVQNALSLYVLQDSNGDRIKLMVYNTILSKINDVFQIGNFIQVNDVLKKKSDPKYAGFKIGLELEYLANSLALPIIEFTLNQYRLLIETNQIKLLEKNLYIDIIGIIYKILPVELSFSATSKRDLNRRVVLVIDSIFSKVSITLWGRLVFQFGNTEGDCFIPCYFRNFFIIGSYEVRLGSADFSEIFTEHEVLEKVKKLFMNINFEVTRSSFEPYLTNQAESVYGFLKIEQIIALINNKDLELSCKFRAVLIAFEVGTYKACHTCFRKMN